VHEEDSNEAVERTLDQGLEDTYVAIIDALYIDAGQSHQAYICGCGATSCRASRIRDALH
jgi:hypothetical protein